MKMKLSRKAKSRKRKQDEYYKEQRSCLHKRVFKTPENAQKEIERLQILSLVQDKRKQKQAERLHWYSCRYCSDLHITKANYNNCVE